MFSLYVITVSGAILGYCAYIATFKGARWLDLEVARWDRAIGKVWAE